VRTAPVDLVSFGWQIPGEPGLQGFGARFLPALQPVK